MGGNEPEFWGKPVFTAFLVVLASLTFATLTAAATPSPTPTPSSVATQTATPTATPNAPSATDIQVRPKLSRKAFPPGQLSVNALQVEATTKDGKPTARVDVFVSVQTSSGWVVERNAEGGKEHRRKAQRETNNEGLASFDIFTGAVDEPFTLRVDAKLGKDKQDVSPLEIQIPIEGYAEPSGSDLTTYELVVGTTFQNDYEPDGNTKGFSKQEALVQLSLDQLWPRRRSALHSRIDLRFSNTPVSDEEVGGARTAEVRAEPKFIDEARSFTAWLNLNYQPHNWAQYSQTSHDPQKPYDANRYGIVTRVGITTRDKINESDAGDTVIRQYGAGLRYTHHQTAAATAEADEVNTVPSRYLEALIVQFEEFAGKRDTFRGVVEGGLRLPGLTTEVLPLYTGFQVNFGAGPDDIRVFAALLFRLDKLATLLGF